jgi:hypothetical protein
MTADGAGWSRAVALPLALAVALLALPAPAAAVPPVRSEVEETFELVYEPCGLTEVGERRRSYTTFLDHEGTELRTLQQVTFDGVITNPAMGETFRDRGHATVMHLSDFSTGFTLLGTVYNIRLPGEGVLLLDVGRLVGDAEFNAVFQSAKAISLLETDAAVCAALG